MWTGWEGDESFEVPFLTSCVTGQGKSTALCSNRLGSALELPAAALRVDLLMAGVGWQRPVM